MYSLNELAKLNAPLTVVCNPNAPTCDFLPVDKLADLAGKLSGVLLIDEAYVDFAEDNAVRLINDFGNVVILRSMSKGYSLAGVRFGFGIVWILFFCVIFIKTPIKQQFYNRHGLAWGDLGWKLRDLQY